MNLQQVKATATEIGDEGEDITSSSLSKYEKAVAALGVSMKQIKNGVISLRNPMEILRDLAAAVSKESKDSIKVANLLSSVGGKYRANQLSALLSNWDIYEKMLSEYNSVEAVGSAMDEAQKSANNWTGSLNQLKNSWTELVNNFVNSDEAVAVIQELNDALQDLSSSETIKGLGVVTNKIVGLITKIDEYKNKVKDIPVLGRAYDFASGLANGTTFLKVASRISDWYNKDAIEAEEAARRQEELNKSWAKSTEALEEESSELNNLTAEYVKIYSGANDIATVKEQLIGIQEQLVDKYGDEAKGLDLVSDSLEKNLDTLIRLREEKNRQYLEDNRESIENAYESLGIDAYSDSKLSQRVISSGGIDALQRFESKELKELDREVDNYIVEIQKKFKEKYGDLADKLSIDITDSGYFGDKKYAFNILEGTSAEEINRIANGLKELNAEMLKSNQYEHLNIYDLNDFYTDWTSGIQGFYDVIKKSVETENELANLESFRGNAEDYERFVELQKESVELSKKLANANINVADRVQAGFDLREVESQLRTLSVKYPEVADLINAELDSISVSFGDTSTNIELATEAWTESLEAAQKGVIANVDKIKSAMEKIYAGEGIDQKSAWEIINLDPDRLLSNIRVDESGKYKFDLQEIIRLKDKIISKEIEERRQSVAATKVNRDSLEKTIAVQKKLLKGLDSSSDEYRSLKAQIEQNEQTMNAYNYTIRNETLLIEYLNKATGNLAETADMLKATLEKLKKEVSDLEKEAEARLKAQTVAVDNIIKKHESELKSLEKEKEALDKQLDSLKKQETEIQNIIQNYETVSDVVRDEVQKQIDAIEKERKAVEDACNERIDKLKSENEEREDALEYEEKLAKLNNAKNNKVLTYDSARGWTYGVNKDALKEAENDLASFENEQAIKTLEKERDEALKGFDGRVEELESYADQWQEVIDSITKSENELIAVEILGADWRDKITTKDTKILNTFKTEYARYNTQLKNNVRTEIENLEKSIEAKDKEISAKQEQIKVWQDYKTEIQETADAIKASTESYLKYLGDIKLNEGSTTAERIKNLQSFSTAYKGIINEISSKNGLIDQTQTKIDNLSKSLGSLTGGNGTGLNGLSNIGSMAGALAGVTQGLVGSNSVFKDILDQIKDINKKLTVKEVGNKIGESLRDSVQNVNQFFGFGSSNMPKPKTDLTVGTPDISKLYSGVYNMPAPPTNMQTKPSGSTTFNIQHMDINGVQNPTEFAKQFEQNINRYWSTKLTESKVK